MFWESALLIWLYMTLLFIIAQVRKDNSIADIGWGVGFILVAWWLQWRYPHPLSWLSTLAVTIWGGRLAVYLFFRNRRKGEEDWRYARWREKWGKWAIPRAYLQVFLLQGAFMWIIAIPLMQRPGGENFHWVQGIGLFLWLAGFLWEAIADWQLYQFKSDPGNKGKIFTGGLWRLSRHPNYFGEIVLWWGVFLLTLPYGAWYIGLLSPLTITWLLMRVSGVPLLEEKYEEDPEYQAYVERTNALIPDITKLAGAE